MTSPLLDRPGAVPGIGVDAGVAAHYGDPFGEQRVLLAGTGIVDRSHRDVLRVCGPDRLSWLHSLTSQHLTSLPVGEWVEALILSPHGHVEHHLTLVDDGSDETWMHVEPGTAQTLAAYLESMKFMLRVSVSDESSSYSVVSVVSDTVVRDEIVPRESLTAVVEARGVPLVGHGAFEAMRVAAGRPRLGFETDHRTIPAEVGWIGVAVHLDKGCYRGQETVARVHNLGRPPRRLVLGHFDGTSEVLPAVGSPVELGDRAVGFAGTSLHHAELGPIGLAVIKRNVADDAQLVVAGQAFAAERLVDA